jgi:hypothetical protein
MANDDSEFDQGLSARALHSAGLFEAINLEAACRRKPRVEHNGIKNTIGQFLWQREGVDEHRA